MTPQVLDFILGLLEYTDKHIELAVGYQVTAKQKGQIQIKMCSDNGDTFIATLHSVLLAPDLLDRLSLITKLMNLVHTFLFSKRVLCGVLLKQVEKCGYFTT